MGGVERDRIRTGGRWGVRGGRDGRGGEEMN